MSVVVRFNPTGLTKEKYDEVGSRLEKAGTSWPPDGLEMHVCFGSDGDMRVSEIWDSEEQCRAFGEHLMPVMQELGIQMSGEPEFLEVYELQKR